MRESIEHFFPDIAFPLDEHFKPLPLENSKRGKYALSLCTLLWEAVFKEYRVDIKKTAQAMVFDGCTVPLVSLSEADRDELASNGALRFLKNKTPACFELLLPFPAFFFQMGGGMMRTATQIIC